MVSYLLVELFFYSLDKYHSSSVNVKEQLISARYLKGIRKISERYLQECKLSEITHIRGGEKRLNNYTLQAHQDIFSLNNSLTKFNHQTKFKSNGCQPLTNKQPLTISNHARPNKTSWIDTLRI